MPSLTIHLRDTVAPGTALRCWTYPNLESSSLNSIPQNTLKGFKRGISKLKLEDDYQIILKAFFHLHAFWKVAIRVDGFSDTDALL